MCDSSELTGRFNAFAGDSPVIFSNQTRHGAFIKQQSWITEGSKRTSQAAKH
jgi:hypothetical protein